MASVSHQCLRRDSGVENKLPTGRAIWDLLQVSMVKSTGLGTLSDSYRSQAFGNERFKPRFGEQLTYSPLRLC